MLKALLTDPNGRTFLLIGLSFENLKRLRAKPLDDHIQIDGKALGLTHDIIITAGRTENDILDALKRGAMTIN
jgi:hypothetical protein